MIQRIQTIWLLLATLTICCLLFLPMVTAIVGNIEYYVIASGLYQKTENLTTQVEANMPLFISTLIIAIFSFINIFNFRNRTVQKRMVMLNFILIIGLSFWCSQFAKKIPGGLENANYNIGMFLPVLALLFSMLALRGIKNDEKLIRSADRLR